MRGGSGGVGGSLGGGGRGGGRDRGGGLGYDSSPSIDRPRMYHPGGGGGRGRSGGGGGLIGVANMGRSRGRRRCCRWFFGLVGRSFCGT